MDVKGRASRWWPTRSSASPRVARPSSTPPSARSDASWVATRELRRLGALLAAAQAGAGRLVRVIGEAGAGKSRLLYELRRTLGTTELTTLEARCRAYGAAIPYLPILDLVRGQCGIEEIDPPETVVHKVRATLTDLGLAADEGAPFLLRLLGIKNEGLFEDLTVEFIRARTVETLRGLLLEGSRRRPLLVVVEDLHWIDEASEDYLGTLVAGLDAAAILVVATHRPDWQPQWPAPAGAEAITLAPLGEGDSLALVQAVASARLPESLTRGILDRASGNPLFLEELARAVAAQGDISAAVPDTLRALLSARMDRLPAAPKRLLQTAAVLGREFPRRLLETVWEGPGSVAAHLAELARLDFVHELSAGGAPAYAFNHALTQEVAYESLLAAHRAVLHETAAQTLESAGQGRAEREWEGLAYHWTRTPRADKAVEALRRVATRAMGASANVEAVAALREAETHAIRLTTDRDRVVLELALERSQAQLLIGQAREGLADLRARGDLVERVDDASLTAQYHFRLASLLGILGDGARAIEHAELALAEARRAGDAATEGKAEYILARESFWMGDLQRGVDHGRRAVVLLDGVGERWWLAMAHWARALSYGLLGRFDEALDSITWASTIADKLRDRRLASQAAWTSGWIHATRGDWATGIEAGRRAVELAFDDMSRALAEGFLGASHLEKGDATTALPLLERAAEAFGRLGFRQLEGWFTVVQGRAHALLGDPTRAESVAGARDGRRGRAQLRAGHHGGARGRGAGRRRPPRPGRGHPRADRVAGRGRAHRRPLPGRPHAPGPGRSGVDHRRSRRRRPRRHARPRRVHGHGRAGLGRARRRAGPAGRCLTKRVVNPRPSAVHPERAVSPRWPRGPVAAMAACTAQAGPLARRSLGAGLSEPPTSDWRNPSPPGDGASEPRLAWCRRRPRRRGRPSGPARRDRTLRMDGGHARTTGSGSSRGVVGKASTTRSLMRQAARKRFQAGIGYSPELAAVLVVHAVVPAQHDQVELGVGGTGPGDVGDRCRRSHGRGRSSS